MTDGKSTTLVGTDGTISSAQPGTPELQSAGLRRWSRMRRQEPAERVSGELGETMRRQLEALGYGTSATR
jgi:hypothetical protein